MKLKRELPITVDLLERTSWKALKVCLYKCSIHGTEKLAYYVLAILTWRKLRNTKLQMTSISANLYEYPMADEGFGDSNFNFIVAQE